MAKVSNVSGNDNTSTLNSSTKSLDPVLLDSLIVNDTKNVNKIEKTDNIVQARSLELQPAAIVDVWKNNLVQSKTADHRRQTVEETGGFLGKLFRCLSWSRNVNYFLDAEYLRKSCEYKDDVPVVSGLRVLSCLSIIAVHLCVFLTQVSSKFYKFTNIKQNLNSNVYVCYSWL